MGFINDEHEFIHTKYFQSAKPAIGFKLTDDGNYDIDGKILFNARTNVDANEDDAYDTIKKDYQSVPNKEYLNNHFLKRDKTGVYYDLRGMSIQNSEEFDESSWNDKTLITKGYSDLKDNEVKAYTDSSFHLSNTLNKDYIDTEIHRVSATTKAYTDSSIHLSNTLTKDHTDTEIQKLLSSTVQKNGSNSMTADFDMGGHKIENLQDPSSNQDAVMKKYLEDHVGNSNIQSSNDNNAFKYIMQDPSGQISEENDVELYGIQEYQPSPHQINKTVINMKLILDSYKQFYSSRIGLNLYPLSNSNYTLCFELLWPSADVETVFMNAISSIETVHNVFKKKFLSQKYAKLICQFNKSQSIGNNYLFMDLEVKLKSGITYPPKFQAYCLVYGVDSIQSDILPTVYDVLYSVTNNKIVFNNQIDLNDQPISGVADAKNDDDGVNYKQLNTLEATLLGKLGALQPKSYYNTIFPYFFDLLDPTEYTMSDSFGAVLSGLGSNLVFQTTKLLKEFKPRDGFTGVFIVNLNENLTGSDDWTIYMAFNYDYKPGDNKRIKIELGNDGSFDFPWVKIEHNKLYLDLGLDSYTEQIKDAYIGEYLNLWYTKIAGQFRIAVCNNAMSINQTFSGFNINATNIKITSDYYLQRIGFSKSVYPINDKVYHKIQFLDKAKGVFFE